MKSILKVTLILLLAIFVTSCNANNNKTSEKGKENKTIKKVAKPVYLNAETFRAEVWDYKTNSTEWIYKGDLPCVIDFYADWCGPCKRVAPIMKELANEYSDKVKIYKVNTDQQRELSSVFGIRSIPSVFFCPKEGKPFMKIGAFSKEQYIELIEKYLINKPNNN
ncbi:MAG: thioredoxin [Bacteroidales bacterium]|nr:thioredoxin [Bacteroidales bacterium]